MYRFYVNGKEYQEEKDYKLLPFLRDVCGLTSVKDGCSEGACGTCHVLIDGKATKACVPKLSKLEGKKIITVEGLDEAEKEIYVRAFGEAGAVQCGFCIPGMVISAKGLIDKNPAPTRADAADAIKNNICRCTGYKKIIDGILLAAKYKREGLPEEKEYTWKLGERVPRLDVREKVLGFGEYPDDMKLDGMIYGSALRSKYPRARVLSIDTKKAEALPGVVAVFTAKDIPGNIKVGHLKEDWDALIPIGKLTHYLGDAIALVAAESLEIVEEAKKLIEVEYEVLEMIRDPYEAMKEGAPLVHESEVDNLLAHWEVVRGHADIAIANSAHVISDRFSTPWTEHGFLEPECALAEPHLDGVIVYTTDQGTYATQHEIRTLLGLRKDQVKVINKLVGGGFGGKEDVTVQHHAAMIAYLTKRPVKVKLTRAESILIHPKRHPMDMEFTLGCDENGIIQGVKATVIADTGAYASLGGPVLQRACTHAAGPYHYENFSIDGKAYYTNNPPAGAFRGFGVTQTCFAMEMLLTKMAEIVGISPWEIRYRNAIRPGETLPNGQIVDDSTGLVETLEAVKDIFENNKYAGIACAMKNAGVGVGIPDWGRCDLRIRDNQIQIHTGASCIGQGLGTVLTQIVVETLGVKREQVVYDTSNTDSPDSGTTSGSRQTLVTGEATRRACNQLKEDLSLYTLEQLEGRDYRGEYMAITDAMGSALKNPVSHVAYGYATQVCILNEEGMVEKIIAAHDVGRAINPLSLEGQIEGGVVMSYGYALTEKYPLVDCKPTAKYGTLGLPRANKIPEVESIIIEKQGLKVAYGAIGVGEITSIPTAPAIAGAYYKKDGQFRTRLPLDNTPYKK